MKIFVAGATGAVGKRLVPLLVECGFEVVGMTRSPEKELIVRNSAPSRRWRTGSTGPR